MTLEEIGYKIDQLERNFEAIGGAINTGAMAIDGAVKDVKDLRTAVGYRIDILDQKLDAILELLNADNS